MSNALLALQHIHTCLLKFANAISLKQLGS